MQNPLDAGAVVARDGWVPWKGAGGSERVSIRALAARRRKAIPASSKLSKRPETKYPKRSLDNFAKS